MNADSSSPFFRLGGRRFRPRWWAVVLALAACAGTVSLGQWQTRRAAVKEALAGRVEQAGRAVAVQVPGQPAPADGLVLHHLAATGVFVPKFTILLDNKTYKGRPGYYVVTPLRLSGSSLHVLVNRGWIAGSPRREQLPQVRTPEGEIRVEGLGLEHAPRVLLAGANQPGSRVWQGLSNDEFARWSGLALQPVFLEQHSGADDGLVRDWPRPDFGIEMHRSYAMQWYLISGLTVFLFIVLSFRRD